MAHGWVLVRKGSLTVKFEKLNLNLTKYVTTVLNSYSVGARKLNIQLRTFEFQFRIFLKVQFRMARFKMATKISNME